MPILTEHEREAVQAIETLYSALGYDLAARVRIYETLLNRARRELAERDDEVAEWLGMSPLPGLDKRDEGYG